MMSGMDPDITESPKLEGVQGAEQTRLETEIAELLIKTLGLDILASEIDPQAPLFGDGLGLDSIDMLEIAMMISKGYGAELRSEDRTALVSLRALSKHIQMSGRV